MQLRQRVYTSVALAVGLLAALWLLPPAALALLFGLVVLLAAWEWSNLAGYEQGWARLAYALSLGLIMLAVYRHAGLADTPQLERVQTLLHLACVWWALALLWVMSYPRSAPLWNTCPRRGLMGMLVLIPPWLALVHLLHFPGGRWLVLFFIALVAAADIGAYFVGRRWGRRKLAVALSPGKTWEGFWGGVSACALLALVFCLVWPLPGSEWAGVFAVVLTTGLASVLGDLLESMVKRQRGVKQSSSLLPGHGGILDRIDGHTAAAPVFALGVILVGW